MNTSFMKKQSLAWLLFGFTLILATSCEAKSKTPKSAGILKAEDFKHYVEYFNRMEDEPIVQAIPNAESWEWMQSNIPLFSCPQDNFEEMWYFRWWSLRKGIRETPVGYVINEFLVERSYADKYNLIACALGHHVYETRWLHDSKFLDQYLHVWYRGNDGAPMKKLRNFSSWTAYAVYNRYLADGDKEFMLDMLPDLEQDYKNWESDHRLPDGMYWQADVQDGMEESVSGGRRIKNARPTINSYMYGNALALSKMFSLSGDNQKSTLYAAKADTLKDLVQNNLWHPERKFFETRWVNGQLAQAREAIGYIPWYFNLPEQGKNYEEAWLQVKDPEGFLAPYGLTTAERRHPEFRTRGVGKCEWDGAVWPFASSQTMTAMANVLNNYEQNYVDKATYYELMNLYVESQYHRGRPYIGEYLDEVTGYWLKGDQLRSRYYNHSTFADLIITGLMGLRPGEDDILEINPLIPDEQWNWFCLDNLMYHGKNIAIVWDSTGKKFKKGQGLLIFCNGKKVAQAASLGKITVDISTY
jgi:hypothetical protein